MHPVFIHGAVRHVTAFLCAPKGIYRFVSHMGAVFEQAWPFEKMLLIQNNSISVPYFGFAEWLSN